MRSIGIVDGLICRFFNVMFVDWLVHHGCHNQFRKCANFAPVVVGGWVGILIG